MYYSSPNNALPREGVDSSVVPDAGGFDVANALTLGTLGVGAVGSLVYALYADRAMQRLVDISNPLARKLVVNLNYSSFGSVSAKFLVHNMFWFWYFLQFRHFGQNRMFWLKGDRIRR